jgi:hypothetical protein
VTTARDGVSALTVNFSACYTEIMAVNSSKRDVSESRKTAYIVVGVTAAVVSAATVAYFFYRKSHQASLKMRNVEELLDKSHELVGEINRRLGELTGAPKPATS